MPVLHISSINPNESTVLRELLIDLLHFADECGVDFGEEVEAAQALYEHELTLTSSDSANTPAH